MLVVYLIRNEKGFNTNSDCDICEQPVKCTHSLAYSRKTVNTPSFINYGISAKGHKRCLKDSLPFLHNRTLTNSVNALRIEGEIYGPDINSVSALSNKNVSKPDTFSELIDEDWQ